MIQFMKTGLRLFALCATLLASLTVKAQISKSWHYYTNEGVETQWGGQGCAYGLSFQDNNDGVNTITVYGYTKGADANVNTNIHLVIPEKVVENGVTYTVTRIDNETTAEDKGVFASTYDIQSVIVPNTVTTIGADAFWSCAGLQEISLGNSVTTIGDNAFQYCAALRSISLPNTLTSVGNHFLCHCNKIEALVIPENLVTIGNYFLHGCESLRDVYLMGSNYRSLGQYPFCSQAQQHDQQVHDCTFWVESEAIYHSNYENYGNWHNADASFTGSYDASCDGTYTNQGNHYAWKGKDEKPFKLYKLRSMTDARNENGELLPDKERLTPFSCALRASSLDELISLINIVKGDLAIVGPRPLLVRYLPYYTEAERHRHDVRPGLTGLAQVSGRNFLKWDQRLAMDIEYVRKISFLSDLLIVFATVKKVFKSEDILGLLFILLFS